MKNKFIFLVVLTFIAGASLVVSGCTDSNTANGNSADSPAGETQSNTEGAVSGEVGLEDGQESTKAFTLEEVSQHSEPDDCWTIVSGSVYDITTYLSSHPGGDVIEQACGTDSTELFENRPDGSGPHPPKAEAILAEYKLGILE